MKLKNSTDYGDRFLRRMISWCCRELDYPVRRMLEATFRNAKRTACRDVAYSGLGGSRRITVRIGPESAFPVGEYSRHGVTHVGAADRIEALVSVTAHEVYHCWQTMHGTMRGSSHNEPAAMQAQRSVLEKFRQHRESLLADWSRETNRPETPKASRQERNAAKAAAALSRWQRKLKLAQTKVKQYRSKVRRYERIREMAAERGQP